MPKLSSFNIIIFLPVVCLLVAPSVCKAQASCPANISVCENTAPFALSGASPAGGVFSGAGVVNGNFNPSGAGTGIKTITYTYTDVNNVSSVCQFNITVNAAPQIACNLGYSYKCQTELRPLNGCGISISTGEPLEVTWSGPGVSGSPALGYQFDPLIAGLGLHDFTVTAKTGSGCQESGSMKDGVDQTYSVSCPPMQTFSITDPPFTLTGGVVIQGSIEDALVGINSDEYAKYTGPGVLPMSRTFDPATAGEGIHEITYTYAAYSCSASCTYQLKSSPLPVRLTSFTASADNEKVTLLWKTNVEKNFKHFDVQKSKDPEHGFFALTTIPGKGTSSSYAFDDRENPGFLPYYYRLKMTDHDGSFGFSSVIWAIGKGDQKVTAYPNPASREITIDAPEALTEFALINSFGKPVFTDKLNKGKNKQITLPRLPAGLYLLKTITSSGTSSFSKVLIE
ncbi:T9SS type A sorting domain-containing protein [Dyadobacter psychrotolerans]|uniref:T9SS type A sorting domain-containing protein n=1 Tax=Dyadobacter psychrotolerans TaxID=2541721 RepID=A0A4R5DUQ3_9BACT|nr:T9SS type A sorting domain-containing protein [Dyadobacter psychrotolerans]TDE17517.1 T9SS type A sorting domain-containing protein [Dyadobacter psychrotolerans]